jgi:putative oxidoreductase
MTPIRTAARTLLGALFVGSGYYVLKHPERHIADAKPVTDYLEPALEAANLPTDTETLVKATGAAQIAGGLLLASGHFTRPAAAVLAATVVPSTIASHPFWNEADPQRKADQRTQFAKNLGLLGGLLYAMVDRDGKPSLAYQTKYAARDAGRRGRYAARDAKRAAKVAGLTAGLSGATAARRAGGALGRAGGAVSDTVGNAAWRASTVASDAGKAVRRTARTARREARLATRALQAGRRLPF